MKNSHKKIIFIVSAITLFSVIVSVVKYLLILKKFRKILTYTKARQKLSINSLQKIYKLS